MKSISIVSKIGPETARRLDRIRQTYGFSSNYEILQFLLSAFLKHADPGGEAEPPDSACVELGRIFEGYENAASRATISVPNAGKVMTLESLVGMYRIGGRGSTKKAVRLYRMTAGGLTSSINEDDALLAVIGATRPRLAKELEKTRRASAETSILDTVQRVAGRIDETAMQVADLFRDAADAEAPRYGERSKKIKSKSVSDGDEKN